MRGSATQTKLNRLKIARQFSVDMTLYRISQKNTIPSLSYIIFEKYTKDLKMAKAG